MGHWLVKPVITLGTKYHAARLGDAAVRRSGLPTRSSESTQSVLVGTDGGTELISSYTGAVGGRPDGPPMVKCCFEDLTLPDVLGSDIVRNLTLDVRHCYRLAGGLSILLLMPGSGPCSVPSPEWTADCMYVYCMYRHWSGLQTAGSARSGPQTRGPKTRHSLRQGHYR